MSDTTAFTEEEFKEFDRITMATSSRDQATRSAARMELCIFTRTHGKEKCDAMWARITASEKSLKRARAH